MKKHPLSEVEIRIWKTLSRGLTYKEISVELDIPLTTVQTALKHIWMYVIVQKRP